jgi:hypothetical protein
MFNMNLDTKSLAVGLKNTSQPYGGGKKSFCTGVVPKAGFETDREAAWRE